MLFNIQPILAGYTLDYIRMYFQIIKSYLISTNILYSEKNNVKNELNSSVINLENFTS